MTTWSSQPCSYTIRVKGLLGATTLSAFPSMVPELKDGETVLTGLLKDPSELFGVLGQIEALGLDLVELRQIPGETGMPAAERRVAIAERPPRERWSDFDKCDEPDDGSR